MLDDRYGDRDLCPVQNGLPEFVLPTRGDRLSAIVPDALRRIGENRCDPTDLALEAATYCYFGGNPWARMNMTTEQYGSIRESLPELTPHEAASMWWAAASGREHVAAHALAFGGAWDGALEFINELGRGNQ